ncbi:MAG: MerR family transcriptional regulator [Colwellia sp.]|nr:MerR family transcriptional regulator [Colwellia sp.]
MSFYTVGKVAKMSGVSKRTLHHYHDIGLLVPAGCSESGYRLYSSQNLLVLQQILLYRECGMPLSEIKLLVTNSAEEHVALLINQQERLNHQIFMHQSQLRTLQKTINRLKGDNMAITDNELYEGFGEKAEIIRQAALDKYGSDVEKVEKHIKSKGRENWMDSKKEGELIAKELSLLVNLTADDESVQKLVMRQLRWLESFYPVSQERFRGLSELYVDDSNFKDFYDKHANGTAKLLSEAMLYFADINEWNHTNQD